MFSGYTLSSFCNLCVEMLLLSLLLIAVSSSFNFLQYDFTKHLSDFKAQLFKIILATTFHPGRLWSILPGLTVCFTALNPVLEVSTVSLVVLFAQCFSTTT